MPWIKFIRDHKVQQWDQNGPHYRSGQSYDIERSYADKYVRRGYAEPCDPPAPAPVEPTAPSHSSETGGGESNPPSPIAPENADSPAETAGHSEAPVAEEPVTRPAAGKTRPRR